MKNLKNLKKEELINIAEGKGVKISSKDTKTDIIQKIASLNDVIPETYNIINKNGMILTVFGEEGDNYICHTKNGVKTSLKKELVGTVFFKEGEVPEGVKNIGNTSNTTGNTFVKEEPGKHRFVLTISKGGSLLIMDNEEKKAYEVGMAPALKKVLQPFFMSVAKKIEELKSFKNLSLAQKFTYKYFRVKKDNAVTSTPAANTSATVNTGSDNKGTTENK